MLKKINETTNKKLPKLLNNKQFFKDIFSSKEY